jgi:hypothetical protein
VIARTIKSQRTLPTTVADPRPRRVARSSGRLRAAVEQLPPETIEAIAQRVAQLLSEHRAPTAGPQLVDAEQLAPQLGLTRAWVYQHAQELGAIRLGHGPKARLRFNPITAAEALADRDQDAELKSSGSAAKRTRGRPRRKPPSGTTLLPIRGQNAAAGVPSTAGRRSEYRGH